MYYIPKNTYLNWKHPGLQYEIMRYLRLQYWKALHIGDYLITLLADYALEYLLKLQ